MGTALWWAAAVAVLWAQRALRAARRRARFRRRFPVNAEGIIIGAEPRHYAGTTGRALLLLHGYNDSPQSLDGIAQRVHAAGWTVSVPLLPGHGRSLEAWDAWRAGEVLQLMREEYARLRASHSVVVVGGLSMGGALACWLAAEAEVDGVALYAPMLFTPRGMQVAVSTARLWTLLTAYVSGGGGRSIQDPEAQRRMIAYGCSTRRSLEALEVIAEGVAPRLGFVKAPLLFVQSREDNRLPEDQSKRALTRIGSAEKTVVWVEGAGHVLTVDRGWEAVAERTVAWLTAHFAAGAPVPRAVD